MTSRDEWDRVWADRQAEIDRDRRRVRWAGRAALIGSLILTPLFAYGAGELFLRLTGLRQMQTKLDAINYKLDVLNRLHEGRK